MQLPLIKKKYTIINKSHRKIALKRKKKGLKEKIVKDDKMLRNRYKIYWQVWGNMDNNKMILEIKTIFVM